MLAFQVTLLADTFVEQRQRPWSKTYTAGALHWQHAAGVNISPPMSSLWHSYRVKLLDDLKINSPWNSQA